MTTADAAATTESAPSGTFPGWRVVAGCFILLSTTSGLGFYGLAVYLNAFSKERGWELSTISLSTTLFFIVGGVVGLWVAKLIAIYDVRWSLIGGGVIGGGALAMLGQVEEQWQLFVVYSFFAVGFAAAGLVPATTVVTRWFQTKRSVALSVASTGLSFGGIAITPFAKRLLDSRGLAEGTPWLGLAFVVGVVPFAWFLVRPDPTADGWHPDGEPISAAAPAVTTAARGMPFEQATRHRFYYATTFGYVFVMGSQVGGIQQLVKLVEDRTDASTAQFAITALAVASVIARLVGGRIVQFLPMMAFTAGLAALQGVAMVTLGIAESKVTIFVGVIIFGATIGNLLMLQPLLIAERFGVRDYPRIFSRSQLVGLIGAAGGPILIGALFDVFGSYRWPYAIAALCSLTGAVILLRGGPASVGDDEDSGGRPHPE